MAERLFGEFGYNKYNKPPSPHYEASGRLEKLQSTLAFLFPLDRNQITDYRDTDITEAVLRPKTAAEIKENKQYTHFNFSFQFVAIQKCYRFCFLNGPQTHTS